MWRSPYCSGINQAQLCADKKTQLLVVPLAAGLVQLVFKHQDLLLQGQVLALGVPQLFAQDLQVSVVLRLPARQLLLVHVRLLLQVPPQTHHLLRLVCRGRHSGGANLLQLQ